MARKTLLTEAEIRQFMKLANIKPLQEMGGELPVPGMRDDEDEDEPGMRDMREADRDDKDDEDEPGMRDMREADRDDKDDDDPPGMRGMREADHDEDEEPGMRDMREGEDEEDEPGMRDMREQEDEEMEMDMQMDAPAGDMPMGDDLGDDMGADMGGKEEQFADIVDKLADLLGLDADVEVGGEEGMGGEVDAIEGGELEADAAPEAPEMEMGDEDDADEPMMESDEDIVQEVARRVAARLLREKKEEDIANKLAERIFRRLASK